MKKYLTSLVLIAGIYSLLNAQNVGIGTTNPSDKLHVKNGNIMIDGDNKYLNLATKSPNKTGIQFYSSGSFSGGLFFDAQNHFTNLSKDAENIGFFFDFSTNIPLVGRNVVINSSESFGIQSTISGADLGGMYVETSGSLSGKPFYGYAINGTSASYHYFDGFTKSWRLFNDGERLIVTNNGNVGINTIDPVSKLHVEGNKYNLASTEGILTLGTEENRLAFGVKTTGASDAGLGRIYAKGDNNKLILGGGIKDVLTVDGDQERIGLGMLNPAHTLDIYTTQARAVNVVNEYTGIGLKTSGYFVSSGEGTGVKHGVFAKATAGTNQSLSIYGGKFAASGSTNSTASVYGMHSIVTNTGEGDQYAIYGKAPTNDPSPTTKSWAFYADGNSHFTDEVLVGVQEGVTGFKVCVGGKVLCEELKVQLNEDWPDYVFNESYALQPLKDVEKYIKTHSHLPGVPSAKEIEEKGGFEVGEMNKILLEKIEELTLHIIKQEKAIEIQNQKIDQLKLHIEAK